MSGSRSEAAERSAAIEHTPIVLIRAFERFNEASQKLEAKYAALLKETEDLRDQVRAKDLEIKKAERLATLGETAAALAHEVRNPLGAMKLFLSLLKKEVDCNSTALNLAEQIDLNITTLNNLVENILQFSKGRPQNFSVVNINAVLSELVTQARQCNGSGITFETIFESNPFIVGNEHGLRQVFNNLILNACQAVRSGGAVKVRTKNAGTLGVEIIVHDNGPGIASDVIERIFDPFVTTKSEGTGLGLAIVKQIVDVHGGKVEARNFNGALLRVMLPRNAATTTEVKLKQ